MFGIGTSELIVILLIGLVVLGPRRLPRIVRSVAKVLRELREALADEETELRKAVDVREPYSSGQVPEAQPSQNTPPPTEGTDKHPPESMSPPEQKEDARD